MGPRKRRRNRQDAKLPENLARKRKKGSAKEEEDQAKKIGRRKWKKFAKCEYKMQVSLLSSIRSKTCLALLDVFLKKLALSKLIVSSRI